MIKKCLQKTAGIFYAIIFEIFIQTRRYSKHSSLCLVPRDDILKKA